MTNGQLSNAASEAERLFTAVSDALSDQMVERLAVTAGNALEVVDKLNDEDTKDAVLTVLDELTALHRAGGLTKAFELVHMINAIRNALSDQMVERLAGFAEHMVTNLATEEFADLAHDATTALGDARDESANDDGAGGLMSAVRLLSDPETQRSLRFLLAFAGKLRNGAGAS
ncbi:MAG: DUF1641 domain-containing protein [Rhodospirillales bacterium]|nr:DUF1641 domain-containing protein [Rhodospirillales bacterium]